MCGYRPSSWEIHLSLALEGTIFSEDIGNDKWSRCESDCFYCFKADHIEHRNDNCDEVQDKQYVCSIGHASPSGFEIQCKLYKHNFLEPHANFFFAIVIILQYHNMIWSKLKRSTPV